MSPLTWITIISIIIDVCICQSAIQLYVKIGEGESCRGESGSLSAYGVTEKQIEYNLTQMYNATGYELTDGDKKFRMSICGRITPEAAKCGTGSDDDTWCFEETLMDGTCIKGIANWRENTQSGSIIAYDALFSGPEIAEHNIYGIRVSVLDFDQYNITCPNKHSIVNYDIICDTNTSVGPWHGAEITGYNETLCNWNVTVRSQYGCFELIPYNPSNGGGGSEMSNLSGGSVFLIIFIVILLTYLILGCAYNSFYHGRVGMDAVPNKDTWTQLVRYTRAGCETTRDTVCCTHSPGAYQEL